MNNSVSVSVVGYWYKILDTGISRAGTGINNSGLVAILWCWYQ